MFQAILNVLAILVLAVAAGFIILLLVDLILGCIDGKRGVIFFKNRKNTSKDNEILLQYNKDVNTNDTYYLQNNNQDLTLDFDKEFEKENEEVQNNNIDMQKAEEEQKIIEAQAEKTETVEEVVEAVEEEPETEVNEEFTFINKISPELEKEIEAEQNKAEEVEEDEENDFDEFADEDDDDDDDKSIEEILNAIRERNRMARNKFIAEEELEADFDEDEEKVTDEEVLEEAEEALEVAENVENKEAVSEEIARLNEVIKELNAKIEAEQAKNTEIEEKARLELENLKKEYEEKVSEEDLPTESLDVLEAKLADLKEREKQNDKDLKANKKEYIPLARIERTLENDQNKLRRREAIVAKKQMVLLGVNNYVADEEKEKKLQEDIDLLEGLKMSVQHCEQVMEANKDRYPVLKKANEILTRNAEQIEKDIQEVEAKITKIKETQANVDNDATGENN